MNIFCNCAVLVTAALAAGASPAADALDVDAACRLVGGKLSSVSTQECLARKLVASGATTTLGRPILYKEYPPLPGRKPLARVLLIGGTHGDEYASFSVTFKWIRILDRHHSGLFHWHIAPAVNLDGLLESPAVRGNHSGVDLNRNLASRDWPAQALSYWRAQAGGDARRYPGPHALSESETRWLADEIAAFRPDVIVSVHAPYGIVDYDGPGEVRPPSHLGPLPFEDLSTFPGSLGRYAGEDRNIPVLTIELASARYMPADSELRTMWVDLVRWLRLNIRPRGEAGARPQGEGK